ncbi:MAG: hypothetical protein A3F26_03865 [Candidatus Ryanbacteria bacterium RIFCSPHIGHO2_12_FULL_47_12b]|uniref:Transcriptional regulator n=2 Tax=Candidatus Ryaniibacteriota TaxID=1817914 RepID=A0A1G2H1Q3_9BACT|nr:MAG: transcriptional regulator [Parcubacteria group bacterium GW2011_GWA2_47_10b]KKU86127.1 MAG: transcriptional regulator [Parcubacteria group bacterium GW2011_GWA1_47_9]OGZ47560.1 MAG: hypothetical protein A2844_02290 [Candidatus Ryanbacteria bacterium RIFCSPHIGHO2_01_FULL_48_80]OGZ50542.1 MAG: hypothetical protein A3C83_02495 [Candidatus Ryanbacteria bacterium RIFCSPHIGHO2_02_FULL_47_25]OGZ52259.1 MAG: hypothetical protein A3F26_03865 [Candidatus Ryanbacteria bacterium RIFCSPHIGHO2_12_FUL
MAGHSKWAQIKHKKAATDARRGKLFGKLARAISVAARDAGRDSSMNLPLRIAVQKARDYNMPQDNIERAIAKAAGGGNEATLQNFTYEAYGPGGVALIITGITDNNNRTSQEIKHLLSEYGAKWASPGSVLWAFEKKSNEWESKPYSEIQLNERDTEILYKLMEKIDEHDDVQEIYANNKET